MKIGILCLTQKAKRSLPPINIPFFYKWLLFIEAQYLFILRKINLKYS